VKHRWIVFCLSMVCLALRAQAANYYVSSINSARSDSNAGTSPSAPWATIDKVKSVWGSLQPGDTVHLERGSVWNISFSSDYWTISRGGNSSAGPITLRGDDYGTGAKPIIRRTVGSGSGFFLVQASYVTLRDFALDGGGRGTLGVAVGGSSSANISTVKILNLSITNLGGSSSQYICGIWLTSFNGRTISDCVIEGNYVADYSAHGLNHYSPYPLINNIWRNNTVKNGFTGGRYPSANSALQITCGGSGNVFEYNYLEDRTTTEGGILGFGKYSSAQGANTIRYNILANSGGYGIVYTIDQSGYKVMADIYGNVFYNNKRAGLGIFPYNSYGAGSTINVYNNTFYNNHHEGGDASHGEVELGAQANNTTIRFNNNLIDHKPYGSTVGLAVGSGFSGTFTHGNNLYWHESGSGATIVTHGSSYSASNVRNYEPTAQQANPQFLNASQVPTTVSSTGGANPDGLKITAGSPAVGTGAALGSPYASDIDLCARTAPWSIGAYQYTSGGGTTNPPPPPPPPQFSAKDYYVSSTHASRSDNNPGTNAHAPWATFDKIKSVWTNLPHGSTIHLAKGSFWDLNFSSDYWYIGRGGSATGGVLTLRGDDYGTGAKPTLRRIGGGPGGGFMLVEAGYVTLRDFALDGGGRGTLGVTVGGGASANVSDVKVQNLSVTNLGGSSSLYICGIWLTSFNGRPISNCLIEGNYVADYSAHGLNHYSPSPLLNNIWRNNTVKNGFAGGRYPSANSALQITSGGNGNVFEYNFLEDRTTTEGGILAFGKYASDSGTNTIRYNVFANSGSHGLIYVIDQSGFKILSDIYGNVFYNSKKAGLAIQPYNSYAAGTTMNVYNNTFYNNCTAGGDATRGEIELGAQCNNTRVNLYNNLIDHRPYGTTVGLAVGSGFSGTLTHGNNLYWHESGSSATVVNHGSTYTVSNVRNYESTAQRAAPLFVDASQVPTQVSSTHGPTPDGLCIMANSPATTNGLALVSKYASDINLVVRTSPWSIGAYEVSPLARPLPPGRVRIVSQ
jgi:hypothetical protein